MRRHALLARFAPFVEPARFARVVSAPYLIAARLQPSYYAWGEAWIDLVFRRDGEIGLVPFVQVEPAMILIREASPMLWPAWLPLEKPAVDGLEALLEPWLLSHGMLGSLEREIVRLFTDDAESREIFEQARGARFLCAARAEDVLLDASPYLYAQRFASGRRIGIRSSDAGFGASILARTAGSVHADLGSPERNRLAQTWYGMGSYDAIPSVAFDVTVGAGDLGGASASIALEARQVGDREIAVARPLFSTLACSFDPADADVERRFSARAREPIVRADRTKPAAVIGGSAGRIGIIVRDDGLIAPEADIDAARALTGALRVQGFDARIVVASAARADEFDLIHLFGHRHVAQFSFILEDAARRTVPVVVTPLFDDFANEAMWGTTAITSMLSGIRDDATQQTIERGMVERRVLVPPESARGKPAYDAEALQAMLRQARAAIFSSRAEETEVRARFGFEGAARIVASVPAPAVPPEPIGALSGIDEYVLVHAAVEPRANQWNAIRAAAAIGVPCVLCGTVEHTEYYQSLLMVAAPGSMWLPSSELSEGEMEALYGGARIFADLSWAGHGAARIVRAAAHGVVPVFSSSLPLAELWPDATSGADPASLESAVAVMRQAWMRAPAVGFQVAERTAQLCDPLEALRGVLAAYAEAAGVRAV